LDWRNLVLEFGATLFSQFDTFRYSRDSEQLLSSLGIDAQLGPLAPPTGHNMQANPLFEDALECPEHGVLPNFLDYLLPVSEQQLIVLTLFFFCCLCSSSTISII
jgi:hypothetical protein